MRWYRFCMPARAVTMKRDGPPRKPSSGYLIFVSRALQERNLKGNGMTVVREAVRECAAEWRALPEDDRQVGSRALVVPISHQVESASVCIQWCRGTETNQRRTSNGMRRR
jgi:hypothetical protein